MKLIMSIFLAILILMQGFGKTWIILSFKLNQQTISKNICVQRNIPNNKCKGKCHLKKQLKKSEQKDQNQIPNLSNQSFASDYIFQPIDFYIKLTDITNHSSISIRQDIRFIPKACILGIFRPPRPTLV
ncbi:MAG: hypothetical protein LKG19_13695 [Saprospiraceae bacterium]|nr:hypothetical protein [Candidatus Defluviibacterium haderslevense]MCC7025791.1 hypothetical protein [Saprospiraceae bacterium]MCI1267621.1 hypothetical protein [Saprospiraceae bacterium]